ncbi:MAG: zinc-dependent alcohol dehydrogenase family protein [Chloroflexota bacterium]|nr:zinc-dependent alcohol dehydrogenase family protein [Chloroflexota bacterium]
MQLSGPAPVSSHPLSEVRRELPEPGAGELLLEVSACAVCRTDLQLVEGQLEPHRLPIVPGHQVVGRVAAVGQGVSDWLVGKRAGAIWLASADGVCSYCRSERENLCPQAQFTGWDVDGGYATHALVRADFAVRIPDAFNDEAAAPLLCGGVIGYRALRLAGLVPGMRLGLYGFGASAWLAIQVARHRGARIHVATRSEGERRRALSLGAESVGEYGDLPPEPLDAAITFAPVGSVVVDALRATAPGGRVVINAIHLDQIPSFDYDLLWSERSLQSVANVTRRDAQEFLALAAEVPILTEGRRYPLANANRALADLAAGKIGAPAAVLIPEDGHRKAVHA